MTPASSVMLSCASSGATLQLSSTPPAHFKGQSITSITIILIFTSTQQFAVERYEALRRNYRECGISEYSIFMFYCLSLPTIQKPQSRYIYNTQNCTLHTQLSSLQCPESTIAIAICLVIEFESLISCVRYAISLVLSSLKATYSSELPTIL